MRYAHSSLSRCFPTFHLPEQQKHAVSSDMDLKVVGLLFIKFLSSSLLQKLNFILWLQKKKINLKRHLPALQTQEPSTGEQMASFLQLHTDEQFTPYVPGRQGVPQAAPWMIQNQSLKTIWGGSDNTTNKWPRTDSGATKARKGTAHDCPRLTLSCPEFKGQGVLHVF